jgi:hypothetical protein
LSKHKLDLVINNLTLAEIKEVLGKVREIEQRHPQELLFVEIKGLEREPVASAMKIIQDIFPHQNITADKHAKKVFWQVRTG